MIRIGIFGYGNLGKGIEKTIASQEDMELVGIFTRREVSLIQKETQHKVYHVSELEQFQDKIDVLILCCGSAKDIPIYAPKCIEQFNTIDSFDNHAVIEQYYHDMNERAEESGKVALISIGWDPGLFSYMRILYEAIIPDIKLYSFWGKGVSQGHSEAIRKLAGVIDAIQYTIPNEEVVSSIKKGESLTLTVGEKHSRECFVVAEEGSDFARIELEIKNMPDYFKEYNTTVHFISLEELKNNHSKLFHRGEVIGVSDKELLDFTLNLDSNPEFTAKILVAYARAVYRLNSDKKFGAYTIADIPLSYITIKPIFGKI